MTRLARTLGVMGAVVALVGSASVAGGPAGAAGDEPGPAPKGQGRGSAAALAQVSCAENGRTNFVYVGTGPFCVNPWEEGDDNGGATAQGVTATEVQIVIYVPSQAMLDAAISEGGQGPSNQGTREPATMEEVMIDFDKVYQHAIEEHGTWQTWGRTPVYQYVEATGSDEAAQRADAVEVIARKPFMVIDASNSVTGAEVFSAELAGRKIMVVSASTNAENAEKQRPYRWVPGQDPDAAAYLTASFVGRTLAGEKAKWAGDDELATKKRSFGAIYPTTGLEIETFERLLRENGGPALAEVVQYDNSDPTAYQEAAGPLVARLKQSGATSVVLFADPTMVTALLDVATTQEYSPEWIVTGFRFHDFDGFARANDEDQMRHAFGLGVLPPAYEGSESSTGIYQWYWGTAQGNYSAAVQGMFTIIYSALHYAGPNLTAKNVEKGLFSVPSTGGASDGTTNFQSGFGRTVGLPYDEYALLGTDRNLAWWNADLTGGANAVASIVGKGKFMYLNDAKRYGYGDFPNKAPKFFVESASVAEIPRSSNFADGVVPPANPCTGCPSAAAAS